MLGDPATIYFMTDLQFFPMEELGFGKSFVRRLYAKLAEPGGYPYDDMVLQSGPFTLSTKRTTSSGSGESMCRITDHNIRIEETLPVVDLDGFNEIVDTVLKAASEFGEECPPILGQRCVIRCLAKPQNSQNSIRLLAGKVSNVLYAIDPFERPPAFFGLRFRFPPVEQEDEGGQHGKRDFVSVRFETFAKDPSLVWIEVNASSFFLEPVELPDTTKIVENAKEAYEFLTNKCIAFLNQFDDRPNEPEEDEGSEEEK